VDMDSVNNIIKYLFDTDNMGAAIIGSIEKNTDIRKMFE
jgi:hypothetical protein